MSPTAIAAFAPGRVNLIGEHTDYNDGLALPFALPEGVTVTATPQSGSEVRVQALNLDQADVFRLQQPPPSSGWRAFARGAIAELQAVGVPVAPVSLTISSDLPQGAGLASSAALTTALCLVLTAASGAQRPEPLTLARLCQRIEQRWVGVQTGLLDQLAVIGAAAGNALLIDFRSLETELIPLQLGGHTLVLLDSGVRRENASSTYNERRDECFEAARRMGKESLRDALIQDLHLLPDALEGRARHVISENGRVQQAATALRTGDFEKLGMLLNTSHRSLRDDYEISTPEVEETVERLLGAGALGARMIGAGSGGHVLGLMPPGSQPPPGAWVVSAGPGASLSNEV